MADGPTKHDIRTTTGVRVPTLVAQPGLIRISTIKRKFVEQMPTVGTDGSGACSMPADLQVVGATAAVVVCVEGENRLVKIHQVRWTNYLADDARERSVEEYRAALREAHAQIDAYPQLFED